MINLGSGSTFFFTIPEADDRRAPDDRGRPRPDNADVGVAERYGHIPDVYP